MKVGDCYSTYEEFEEALNNYKLTVFNEYWIRDARTISNQRKRFPDTVNKCNELLKYYHIRLACIKGGRPFVSRNVKPNRKSKPTLKQGCKASIFIRMSKCQQYLTVTAMNSEHNHSNFKEESLSDDSLSDNDEPTHLDDIQSYNGSNGKEYFLDSACSMLDREFEAIGANVSCKLKRMSTQQRYYAELLINKVLISGLQETLSSETDLMEVYKP